MLRSIVLGVRFGFPPCCILAFAWDVALGRTPGAYRDEQCGVAGAVPAVEYVPCGWHYRRVPARLLPRVAA